MTQEASARPTRSWDINNLGEDESRYPQYVFKNKVKVLYPKKSGLTRVLIMPAFPAVGTPDALNPLSYMPYRDPASDKGQMSEWAIRIFVHKFCNGQNINVLSPLTFNGYAQDPFDILYKAAAASPAYYSILGKLADGKNDPSAYTNRTQKIRRMDTQVIMNAVDMDDQSGDTAGNSQVFVVPRTAIAPIDSGKHSSWGLFAELNRMQRNIPQGTQPHEYSKIYQWGDITDPHALQPCQLMKMKSPTGGADIYNMAPIECQPVVGTQQMLASRVRLISDDSDLDCLVHLSTGELVELACSIYQDYPELLKLAFEHAFPGVENFLQKAGIVGRAVHQPGAPAAAAQPLQALPAPSQAPAQSFQPAPAPTQQFSPRIPDALPAASTTWAPAAGLPAAAPAPAQAAAPALTPIPGVTAGGIAQNQEKLQKLFSNVTAAPGA